MTKKLPTREEVYTIATEPIIITINFGHTDTKLGRLRALLEWIWKGTTTIKP